MMQMKASDRLILLSDDERYPHRADTDPMWNDSGLIGWVDAQTEVAGFFRYGFQPNRGVANYQCGISTYGGLRFRNTIPELRLSGNERRDRGFRFDDFLEIEYAPNQNRWRGRSDACEFDLTMEEYIPLFDHGVAMGITDDPMNRSDAANHYDTAGHVRGTVRIGDERFDVDCLGYGDRSWGPRIWMMRTHRWCVGTFGEDLSFTVITATAPPDMYLRAGYVVREGNVERIVSTDVLVFSEDDGVTHRGAAVAFVSERGVRFEVQFECHDCVLLHADRHIGADGLSTIRMGDRVGVGILECSYNARGGVETPSVVIGAAARNGVSTRDVESLLSIRR